MLLGDFTDALRDIVGAFGHHLGGVHCLGVEFDGDGKVGGVGDDHVGRWNGRHHAPLGHFQLHAANTGFDLGVAVALLAFFLDLLFGHHQILAMLPALVGKIRRGQNDEAQADEKGDLESHLAHVGHGIRNFGMNQGGNGHEFLTQQQIGDQAHKTDFKNRLAQLHQGL